MGLCHLPVANVDPLVSTDTKREGCDVASSINVCHVGLHELEAEE